MTRIAGLAGNRGRNLMHVADLAPGGAELSVVLTTDDDAPALDAASERGIPTEVVELGDDESRRDHEARVLDALADYDFDLVCLDGYLRILSDRFLVGEPTALNGHPSLLPAFPGAEAYRQAREEGVRIAGVTAHYVTTDLDQGPIITQRAFNVPASADVEEIERRGQPLEAEALLEAVQLHLDSAISVYHGRTELRDDVDAEGYQFGLPNAVDDLLADRPVDGLGSVVSRSGE